MGAREGGPNDALSNLQEGAFEVTLKGAIKVALRLHLWLHLLMQPLIY